MKQTKSAFTLVELIVSITIIAILSATGFVAFTGYLSTGRDANRITQLSDLRDGMQLYSVKSRLPLPENSVNITASGGLYAYQGDLSEDIVSLIGYQGGGKDPEYDTYPVYMLGENKRDFQLMTFLSESDELSIIPQSYAEIPDYSVLFPATVGSPLGILIDIPTKQPLHTVASVVGAGEYDVITGSEQVRAYKDSNDFINSTDGSMQALIPNQSCKRLLEMGKSKGSDVYTINPTGSQNIRVYCDMETDGGGWTMFVNNDNRDDESLSGDCKPRLSGFSGHSCGSVKTSSDFTANANGASFNELIFAGYEGNFNNILTFQYMKWDDSQLIPSTETFETIVADSWDNELGEHEGKNTLRCTNDAPRYVSLQNGTGPFEPHFALGGRSNDLDELSFVDEDNNSTQNTYGLDDYQDGDGCSDVWTNQTYRGVSAYIMVR